MRRALPWALLACVLAVACRVEVDVGDNRSAIDDDGDGFSEDEGDCNDANNSVYPDAPETCDGRDNDCDLEIDERVCAREQQFSVVSQVDLLLVVDDTESVREERGKLIAGMDALIAPLWQPNHDIHLGVITSNLQDPEGAGVLHELEGHSWIGQDLSEDQASSWLEVAIDVPSGGDNLEQGRAAIYAALAGSAAEVNGDFRRPEAYLAVLLLSDEDDHTGAPTLEDFTDWVAVEPGLDRIAVHGIVSDEPDDPCGSGGYGEQHLELVAVTGGTVLPICAEDYGSFLEVVGQNTSQLGPPRAFGLLARAVPSSLAVEVRLPSGFVDVLSTDRFVYDAARDRVVLIGDLPPAPGSKVTVRYTAVPTP